MTVTDSTPTRVLYERAREEGRLRAFEAIREGTNATAGDALVEWLNEDSESDAIYRRSRGTARAAFRHFARAFHQVIDREEPEHGHEGGWRG